ncbi:hypothetical protein HEP87_63940 [Streptomyces sp. S1D4-11]
MLAKLTRDLPLAGVDAAGAAHWQDRLARALLTLAAEEPRAPHRGPAPALFRLADPPAPTPAPTPAAVGGAGRGHIPDGHAPDGHARTGTSRTGTARAGTARRGRPGRGRPGRGQCGAVGSAARLAPSARTVRMRTVPRWGRWPGGC